MARKRYPVVILHGWMLTSDKYAHLKRELENKDYKVYVPNMPGNGKQPAPKKPWTLDDYVQFIKQFCLNNNIKECQIIGHSFGGRVGIKLAAGKPRLVKKLILTGVPGFRVEGWLRRKIFHLIAKVGKAITTLPFWPTNVVHYVRRALYRLARVSDYSKTTGVMRETFKNIVNENLAEPMRKISCPTVLAWGEEDSIVPIFVAKKMRKEIASSKLIVIPDAGHDLPIQDSEVFSKIIK